LLYWLDKTAQTGMLIGVFGMLQPWWRQGLRYGFFATAAFTILHIFTSHQNIAQGPKEDGIPPA